MSFIVASHVMILSITISKCVNPQCCAQAHVDTVAETPSTARRLECALLSIRNSQSLKNLVLQRDQSEAALVIASVARSGQGKLYSM